MADVLAITDSNFEEEVLKSDIPVMVEFFATWCTHSRRVSSLIDDVADVIGREKSWGSFLHAADYQEFYGFASALLELMNTCELKPMSYYESDYESEGEGEGDDEGEDESAEDVEESEYNGKDDA